MSDILFQMDSLALLVSIVVPAVVIGLYELYLAQILPTHPMDPEIRDRLDMLHTRIVEQSARRAAASRN